MNPSKSKENVEIYLQEIADRLINNHASVMIGAGFSKNASSQFPNWDELGKMLFKKLNNGKEPSVKDHFLNPMKLASEIDALFGKNYLNSFIESCIPYKNFSPSQLHVDLLQLPWLDIFTTNYDTLLERASKQVLKKRFDIVTMENQLPFSRRPRIIKLHGCFENNVDLTISEDDYRDYPKKHAPFVNTVQQSLIENTLCLIGFSGDDPNFLNWINWILYNLGKDVAPHLYLIEFSELTEAKRKLLEKRNISVVNLGSIDEYKGKNPEFALSYFINYLTKQTKSKDREDWPENVEYIINPQIDKQENKFREWTKQRKEYPQWLILPYHNREKLREETDMRDISIAGTIEFPYNIDLLYELNWRIEKCLYPIWNNHIPVYEKILLQINPFADILVYEEANYNPNNNENIEWVNIRNQWIELHFSLLRLFRQEGFWDKWEKINQTITKIQSKLTPEQIARWFYEKALYAYFQLDIKQVKSIISEWTKNDSLPWWEAKRAALLAELGESQEAYSIIDSALQFIREKLNLSGKAKDYELISQESYIMLLHWYIYHMQMRDYNEIERRENLQKLNLRWKEYKSIVDPWGELKLFTMNLKHTYSESSHQKKIYKYDLGQVSRTTHFGPDNEVIGAYSYLVYCEEIGLPIFDNKAMYGALERIGKHSPFWALVYLLRTGDKELVNTIFNRESVSRLNILKIDETIDIYLKLLYEALSNIPEQRPFFEKNIYLQIAKVVPEIISRLCSKCSTSKIDKIFDFLYELYQSDKKWEFEQIEALMDRSISALNDDQVYERLPRFFEFPILPETFWNYKDPFMFFKFSSKMLKNKTIDFSKVDVDFLLRKLVSEDNVERDIAFARLYVLYPLGVLTKDEEEQFINNLWAKTDSTGLPLQRRFIPSSLLGKLPHPSNINPLEILKKYILEEPIPIESEKEHKGVESYIRGHFPPLTQIYWGSKRWRMSSGIVWNQNEIIELLEKFFIWWHSDKEYLKKTKPFEIGESIADEFKMRFGYLVDILAEIIFLQFSADINEEIKVKVKILLYEMESYKLPCMTALVASLIIFPDERKTIEQIIRKKSLVQDKEILYDSYYSIYMWMIYQKDGLVKEIPEDIIDPLVECIKWRYRDGVFYALQIFNLIIKEAPEFISENNFNDIILGLEMLLLETASDNATVIEVFEKRMDMKKHGARLAHTLYQYFEDQKIEIPQPLINWKEVCENPNEFTEIRKEWSSN